MAELRARDGNVCHYCGVTLVVMPKYGWFGGPEADAWFARSRTIDHKVPVSRGGSDEPGNLVLACRSCNTRKGTTEYAAFLRFNPRPVGPVDSPPLPPIAALWPVGEVPSRVPGVPPTELVVRRLQYPDGSMDPLDLEAIAEMRAALTAPASELPELVVGDVVEHRVFGRGEVAAVKVLSGDDLDVTVCFENGSIRTLSALLSRLRKADDPPDRPTLEPPTVRCLSAGRGCVNRVPPDVDYSPDCELEGWHNHRGAS